jgi:hypothetical protein
MAAHFLVLMNKRLCKTYFFRKCSFAGFPEQWRGEIEIMNFFLFWIYYMTLDYSTLFNWTLTVNMPFTSFDCQTEFFKWTMKAQETAPLYFSGADINSTRCLFATLAWLDERRAVSRWLLTE